MPTTDEFWFVAEQVARERSGLVVGFGEGMSQPELGSTLDNVLGFTARQPIAVVARAELSDWNEQVAAFYRFRPGWGRGRNGDPNGTYYRIKFDDSVGALTNLASSASVGDGLLPSFGVAVPSFGEYGTPSQGLMGASFAPRLLARIIDFALHYCAGFFAGFLFRFLLDLAAGGRPPRWVLLRISHVGLPLFLAGTVGALVYHVVCTAVYGSTLGKMVCSLQVLQEDGSPCGLRSAFIRELGYFVDTLFFGLIGFSAMRGNDRQQRFGDQWAHTIVCWRKAVPLKSRQPTLRFLLGIMLGVIFDIAALLTGLVIEMNY